MLKITIISVGTLKEDYLRTAFAEYLRRASAYAAVGEISLKEEYIANEGRAADISAALTREGERILAAVPKGAYKIALCVEGRQMSSEKFAATMAKAAETHGETAFIIGSSHGLSDAVKNAADIRLSLSEMTFPHQLCRVLLSECIYRALSINAGAKYHK